LHLPRGANDQEGNPPAPITRLFLGMVPMLDKLHWHVEDQDCWIGKDHVSPTRLTVKYIETRDGSSLGGGRGVIRFGGGRCEGVNFQVVGFNVGPTFGRTWSDVDFLDFNGDRYPDVVGGGAVQVTQPNGGLAGRVTVGGFDRLRETTTLSGGASLGATMS